MSSLAEADLVRAMRSGAPTCDASWAEFERRHAHSILGFIQSLARDLGQDTCEELLQETVVRAALNFHKYKHIRDGGLKSWCIKIAENCCINMRRARNGHPTPDLLVSYDAMAHELLAPALGADAQGGELGEASLSVEQRQALEAFSMLGPVDQAVIRHHFVDSLPDREIAALVERKADHIRKIRYKAVEKWKRAYERLRLGRRRP